MTAAAVGMQGTGRAQTVLPTAFGVQMAVAAAGPGAAPQIAAALALAGVLIGVFHRPASTVAVLAAAVALAVGNPAVFSAALCGLSATVYLLLRHTPDSLTAPALVGMLVFSTVAVLAGLVPWRLAWLPLLAPAVVVAVVVASGAVAGAGLFRSDPVRYE